MTDYSRLRALRTLAFGRYVLSRLRALFSRLRALISPSGAHLRRDLRLRAVVALRAADEPPAVVDLIEQRTKRSSWCFKKIVRSATLRQTFTCIREQVGSSYT